MLPSSLLFILPPPSSPGQLIIIWVCFVVFSVIILFRHALIFFFLKNTAPPEIYPLPLHHALPISLPFGVTPSTPPKKISAPADPGYEAGMFAARASQSRVVKVPLTKTYAHDVKAMLAAAPDA